MGPFDPGRGALFPLHRSTMRPIIITLLIWPLALLLVALDRLGRLADLLLAAHQKRQEPARTGTPSWYVPLEPEAAPEPATDYASLLEALTVRDLRKTCVTLGLPRSTYRCARKADLVALLADLHVNPTL